MALVSFRASRAPERCGILARMGSAAASSETDGDSRRILVAGCGYVGTCLAQQLAAGGSQVFALRRTPQPQSHGIVSLCADLTRIETLDVVPENLDAIVYAAGAGSSDEAAYRAAYLDGVQNLVRSVADRASALPRIIFCSSTAVYGQERGEWVDEDSPVRPRRWNGELLLAAERLLRAHVAGSIVVRLGGIYGPGRTRLIDSVREGTARSRREPHFSNRIHRDDAAGVLAHLALTAAPEHDCYLGVDDEPADDAEVLAFLAYQLGVRNPEVAEAGDAPARRGGSKRCRNSRIRDAGYDFVFPSFRDGYIAMLGSR
ncbi:MAG: NAD-dependent epimerase/dehydratase family protein [Myxococcota bacterium]|nr:NAD-dependent epimerase/dehydratase family protein [Myxococcota bacterium]